MIPEDRQLFEFDREQLADGSFEVYEEEVNPRETPENNAELSVPQSMSLSGPLLEITGVIKPGPLTKHISLSEDGELVSDGSACVVSTGLAWRECVNTLEAFGDFINRLPSNKAILLGALRDDLSYVVQVVTKRRLHEANPNPRYDRIARTGEYIQYRPGQVSLALIDIDRKGMPQAVKDRVEKLGGLLGAVKHVLPELAIVGHVVRRSTSSCIRRDDTGEALAGSGGAHVYVLVQDGTDIQRFLYTLHARCWLNGLGWMTIGAAGQLLNRSLVDRMVYAPERLVFEGTPELELPLVQDLEQRRAEVFEGPPLDTIVACPPLRVAEKAKLQELEAGEAHRLTPERSKARQRFVEKHASGLSARSAVTVQAACRIVEQQIEGVLRSEIELPFDDDEFRGCTVDDVLGNPDRFEGATLADPIEGIEYGRCKAKILRKEDGTLFIHSFAHGRILYELMFSATKVEALLDDTPDAELVDVFVNFAVSAKLTSFDRERLRNLVHDRTGINKRTIDQAIKKAEDEAAARRELNERARHIAERRDPRPAIPVPPRDDPFLPQMEILNDILGSSTAAEPPARDFEGYITQVHIRRPTHMHELTPEGSNAEAANDARLPAPEYPLLTRLDHAGVAELIEEYIDYISKKSRSVHLPAHFVRHFVRRNDTALPLVTGVATLPVVLVNGTILSGRGLDRERGIVFRVPDRLDALIPPASDCTDDAVAAAIDYLINEWLCDVATNFEGKCILIAIAATIIERTEFPERPAFFIVAGNRGSGKTTVLNMISIAVQGVRAAASGWSPSEEERRKALLAYLSEGVALIAWDNIARGTSISCPSIEKALTAETYKDRVLGVSESRTVPATTVQVFNGNNISPRGDMASRSILVRLAVNRPDPENREFKHSDPIGWTQNNRARILQAIYTILLGNPRLRASNSPPAETRFKTWFNLVGSALENAARLHAMRDVDAEEISFREIFLEGEAGEEQTDGTAAALSIIRSNWPNRFKASEVSMYIALGGEKGIELRGAIEQAAGKSIQVVTATILTWRLKALTDVPTLVDGKILALKYTPDEGGHGGNFRVVEIR